MPDADFTPAVKVRLARLVARTVSEYFRDPAHRAEFEKWHLETYGTKYVWKKGCKNEKVSDGTERTALSGGDHPRSRGL